MSDVNYAQNVIHRITVNLDEAFVKSVDTGQIVEITLTSPITSKTVTIGLSQGQINSLTTPGNTGVVGPRKPFGDL